MAKKKVVKKVVEPRTCLTELEMVKLDLYNEQVKRLELEVLILKQKHQLLTLELEARLTAKQQEVQCSRDSRKKLNDNIRIELMISSDKWGYDPITGEVQG